MLNSVKKVLKRYMVKLNDISLPSYANNFEYNRKTWNRYAKFWNKNWIHFEKNVSEQERQEYQHLGVEWGNIQAVNSAIREFILPYITKDSIAGEIGSGGARVASKVANHTKHFYCFDISSEMLKRAKKALSSYSNVSYMLLDKPKLPASLAGTFDFLYSFDVFVHLDLHTIWKYFKEISIALKKGGKALIHTSNLKSPGGWERFAGQDSYSVQGHYFISPEIVHILAKQSGLAIIKESAYDPDDFYLNRDYIAILEK